MGGTKRLWTVLAVMTALLLCSQPLPAKANKQTVVLSCDLHCQGCCDKVMKHIAYEKGVKDLVCDLKTKTVTVTFDADKTDVSALLQAFDKIGKPAKVKASGEPRTKEQASDTRPEATTGSTPLE